MWLLGCPWRANSSAIVRHDLLVQRNRLIGSPAVLSSMIFFNAAVKAGSASSKGFRPAPGLRTRSWGGRFPCLSSRIPRRIVRRDIPVRLSLVFSAFPLLLPAQDPQPPRAGNLLQGEPQVLDNGQAASQITAMGDVHGDFKTFRALLRSVGLIDSQDLWCGGTRHLVQTGDL